MRNVLFETGGFYVTNEGSVKAPSYHVWVPSITHAFCDSAYQNESLAIARCKYLFNAREYEKLEKAKAKAKQGESKNCQIEGRIP